MNSGFLLLESMKEHVNGYPFLLFFNQWNKKLSYVVGWEQNK